MRAQQNTTAVVVGAGIIGICCALELQKKGFTVTLVDPEEPGSQTSFGNAGALAVTEVVPLSMPGVMLSAPGWLLDPAGPLHIQWRHLITLLPWFWRFIRASSAKNIARIVPTLSLLLKDVYQDFKPLLQASGVAHCLHKGGSLTLYKKHKTYQQAALEWDIKRQQGIRFEALSAEAIYELEPDLARIFAIGVRNIDWGHIDNPKQLCDAFFNYFLAQGGQYRQTKVTGFKRRDNTVIGVDTACNKPVEASKIIVAAGVWSAALLSELGCQVSLESERGYHATFATPCAHINNMVICAEEKFVMTPMSMGLRVAGTAEFSGLNTKPRQQRTDVLIKKAKTILPRLDTQQVSVWSGHRPATPDSLPVISAVPGYPNCYCAFGHGHLGLTLGPTTGRLMADLMTGEITTQALAALKVDRF